MLGCQGTLKNGSTRDGHCCAKNNAVLYLYRTLPFFICKAQRVEKLRHRQQTYLKFIFRSPEPCSLFSRTKVHILVSRNLILLVIFNTAPERQLQVSTIYPNLLIPVHIAAFWQTGDSPHAGMPGCAVCATPLLIKLSGLLKQAGYHMLQKKPLARHICAHSKAGPDSLRGSQRLM